METVWIFIVGLVLSVDGGNLAVINQGLIDGLRPGDRADFYYTLKVDSVEKRIDSGVGKVVEVNDFDATVEWFDQARVQPGQFVEIRVPETRTSAASLLAIAQRRQSDQQFDVALHYLERIQKLLPNDSYIQGKMRTLKAEKKETAWRRQQLKQVPFYRDAAEELLERGDLRSAQAYAEKIIRVAPDDAPRDLLEKIERMARNEEKQRLERERLIIGMISVPEGVYEIGFDISESKAYNQHPRFKVRVKSFWIDRTPVSNDIYRKYKPDFLFPLEKTEAPVVRTTYTEAARYCRNLGLRLPTEFEWEIAVLEFEVKADQISEWTSSWYKPYPGNVIWEVDFGEESRTLRGPVEDHVKDPRVRRYMEPNRRDPQVGFRCACDGP